MVLCISDLKRQVAGERLDTTDVAIMTERKIVRKGYSGPLVLGRSNLADSGEIAMSIDQSAIG
jgi:hypothetical protein